MILQRYAERSPTHSQHEVHLLRSNSLGSTDKVPFVLAVFIINHDDDSAFLNCPDGLLNRLQRHAYDFLIETALLSVQVEKSASVGLFSGREQV